MRMDIRMAGSGGQGLLWMASTLAVAATRFCGLKATQSASYGAATRGGYSRGDVVVSDEEIDYPWVMTPDVLMAMSTPAFQRDLPSLRQEGTLILDSTLVTGGSGFKGRTLLVPVTGTAERELGNVTLAGVVTLGVMGEILGWLKPGSLRQAVESVSPSRFRAQNLAGYDAGVVLYRQAMAPQAPGGRNG